MAGHASFAVRRVPALGVDIVEADSDRRFARHMHDQFGIGLVTHGGQRSASGRGEVEATAGDLITVNPSEVHDGTPIGDGARRWRMLYFTPQHMAGVFEDMTAETGVSPREFAHPVLRSRRAAGLFGALYKALTQTAACGDPLAIDETLPLLLEQLLDQPLPVSPLLHTAAGRARAMIDDDPLASASLASLAQEAGLSRFQLVRAFARLTGLTPHAYRMQRRVQRARQLIATGMPLADAALASGFADQSHMTRRFVRSFGFSPGLYARHGG